MYLKNLYLMFSVFLFMFSSAGFLLSNYLLIQDLVVFLEYSFFGVNSSKMVMVLLIDWMSMIFISVVFMISSMVVFYSNSYMGSDTNKLRFLYLVILFVLSMGLMIISPNMISILLGWDGLGLISYCLVIYYQNLKSYNAGMLTVMSNRVGDIAILMVIAWMINFGGWNFYFYMEQMKVDNLLGLIGGLVILASMTKSAQIPFSSWLPAAMAAPTPVSALVHSSTLVTAGVYLMIRFSSLLNGTYVLEWLMILGVLTMFMSGLGANFEYDLKKIIALSTLSQLGLMMMILGMGYGILAFFHLLTHAFFKSLLFLCAGVLIHSFKDLQDLRMMGGVTKFMPLISGIFNISNMALCGIPFLAGFYSKDLILEMMFMKNLNLVLLIMVYLSMGLTVSYSIRVVYWSFLSEINMNSVINIHFNDKIMNNSMFMLFLMSVISGSMLGWILMPLILMAYLPSILKLLIIYVIMGGLVVGMGVSKILKINLSKIWYSTQSFLGGMWFMPLISTNEIVYRFLWLGVILKKNLDYGWSEKLLVYNIVETLKISMAKMQLTHMNYVKIYMLIFVGWIFIFVTGLVMF